MTKILTLRSAAVYGISILAIALFVGATATYAASGEERADREALRTAVQEGDYNTWAALAADHPNADAFVNETTFNVLVEASALRDAGDREAARQHLRDNDIRPHRRPHRDRDGERPERDRERPDRTAFRAAVDAGDYDAWAALAADHPNADTFVNETTFSVLVEASALRDAGDKEAARQLLEDNDIRPPHRGPRGGQQQ